MKKFAHNFLLNENMDDYQYNFSINSISWSSLEKILIKNGIPFEYYSLSGYQEESLCLDLHCSSWFVYYAERGRRYEEKKFINIDSACIEIIKRFSLNEQQEKLMVEQYEKSKSFLFGIGFSLSMESEIIIKTKKIREKILNGETIENCKPKRISQYDLKSLIERRNNLLKIVKNEDLQIYNNLYNFLDLSNDKTI